MEDNKTVFSIKSFFRYISTVISWTIFVLLVILGILLLYYFISVKLLASKGENYEPLFSIYSVQTGSMEPTIKTKDVIVNVRVNKLSDVKVNDVITFISTWQVNYGMTMTHRVVGIQKTDDGKPCLVTKGDNNTQEDAVCVTEENLVGVVKAVIPGLGKIQLFLSSTLGWLLIIIIPALYIIVKDIMNIFSITFKDGKDNKNNKDNKEDKDKKKDEVQDDLIVKKYLKNKIEDLKKNNNEEHKDKYIDDKDYEHKSNLKIIEDKEDKDEKKDENKNDNDELIKALEEVYEDLENVRIK